jgi:hypothetical protein
MIVLNFKRKYRKSAQGFKNLTGIFKAKFFNKVS